MVQKRASPPESASRTGSSRPEPSECDGTGGRDRAVTCAIQNSSERSVWRSVAWELGIMLSLAVLLTLERGLCPLVDRLARFRRSWRAHSIGRR